MKTGLTPVNDTGENFSPVESNQTKQSGEAS
jgi:hypothetical protein